ncbi:polysaccharide biosynthesis tyrosine autokinase [Luteipulveratus mongoliensis]|uniref:polysaccharide biosynthesis tyrosine autokinase n=1 Tax=Luteipulveratus mongoliensis TaxID=571913 RepID=UPI000698D6DC|nr:polysaccharide biosynthesis tyrosine autokinase [Luteipulveratus mongoliensis]
MELTDYLRILRRHWRVVLLAALVGGLVAAAYTLTRPKVYAATATGFVSSGSSTSAAEASVGDTLAKSRATSYVDVAKSRGTAAGVARRIGTTQSPDALVGKVSVRQPEDTVLIKVTVKASSPAEARATANAWITELAHQVQLIERSGTNGLRVVPLESAQLPASPTSPVPKRDIPIGIVVGSILGLTVAVGRSQLDRRVRDQDEIRRQFGVPVIASIPGHKALDRGRGTLFPVLIGERRSGSGDRAIASEALLKLRTNLRYMDVDNPPRVVVVTSPAAGDGKSTVASNLASALGASGQQTVLVDADLRRPVVAEGFGLVEGAGLTDVLVGRVDVQEVLQEAPHAQNLWILASGNTPPNPSEILGSRAMQTLVEKLSSTAFVIIDAPPVLPVTDAAVLSTIADGALVVVSSGRTVDTQLQHAIDAITEVNGRVLGIVLNRVAKRDSATYYGYRREQYGSR